MGRGTKKWADQLVVHLVPAVFFLRTVGQIWCENYVCSCHHKWVVAAEIPIL